MKEPGEFLNFKQKSVSIFGLLLFCLYLIFPYYKLFTDHHQMMGFYFSVVLCSLIWYGLTLKVQSLGLYKNNLNIKDSFLIFLIGLFSISIVFPQFFDPIEWKGDESYHILRSIAFMSDVWSILINESGLISIILLFFLVYFLVRKKIYFFYLNGIIILLLFGVSGYLLRNSFVNVAQYVVNYPPVYFIYETLFANQFFGTTYNESIHRLSVFIPYVLIIISVYLLARKNKLNYSISFLLALYIASMPNLRHHSTIVYIDLLPICILNIAMGKLYFEEKLSFNHILYSGVLISLCGLFKETTLPFVIAYFFAGIFWLFTKREVTVKKIICLLFILFLPFFPQLFLRNFFNYSVWHHDYHHYMELYIWKTYCKALAIQFTIPVLFLFFFGNIFLKSFNARYFQILSVFVLVCYFIFLLRVDVWAIGVSRFQLYFIPILIPGVVSAVSTITNIILRYVKCSRIFNILLCFMIVILICTNLQFSVRENKSENWMSPFTRQVDEFYPFDQAFEYLGKYLNKEDSILIEGGGFPYFAYFYLLKYKIKTSSVFQDKKVRSLEESLNKAQIMRAKALIYMQQNENLKLRAGASRFKCYNKVLDVYVFNSDY